MTTQHTQPSAIDHDVVIVGGGPAGSSAGVFTARYGLDTVIFDRGRSSIQQCAHMENYLGFPAGIDIGTFYALMHDHAEQAGCEIVPDLVESVDHTDNGFVVETQEGRHVTAKRIVAATRYGGEYLRPLDDNDAMFETYEHGGEKHEQFDRSYAAMDGTTPIDGLYIASPSEGADRQAIIAAGRGARVGVALVEAVRRERFPSTLAAHYDWLRRESARDGEWNNRKRWQQWFDDHLPDDHVDDERRVELREAEIDRRFETYLSADERDRRARRGQDRLLEHIDDDRILEYAEAIKTETQVGMDTH